MSISSLLSAGTASVLTGVAGVFASHIETVSGFSDAAAEVTLGGSVALAGAGLLCIQVAAIRGLNRIGRRWFGPMLRR
jgi:hypothetical protein